MNQYFKALVVDSTEDEGMEENVGRQNMLTDTKSKFVIKSILQYIQNDNFHQLNIYRINVKLQFQFLSETE